MKTNGNGTKPKRLGIVIDLDRCTGCGACMVACAVENNVAPGPPKATERKGITLLKCHAARNGARYPESRSAFFPVMCQQCGHDAPCVSVCPQQAVDVDPNTGVVGQMPQRCLGCRYCMTACPYHARYFNWWDPAWPVGMEKALNPGVAPRMRGVVEKCNLCHGRWQAARSKAAAAGEARDRSDRRTTRLARRPVRRAPSCLAIWTMLPARSPSSRACPTRSACWNGSEPNRRFTTAPNASLGAQGGASVDSEATLIRH